MKILLQTIEHFLTQHTVWIPLTIMGFVSYILNEIYQAHSFTAYFYYFITLCLLYSPILIFNIFRKKLQTKYPFYVFASFWGICFLVYPILIPYFEFSFDKFPLPITRSLDGFEIEFLRAVSGGLILTEIIILSNDYILQKIKNSTWIKKINLEKGILITLFLLAIILAATNNFTKFADPSVYQISDSNLLNNTFAFFYLTAQYSLTFLAYYFFYYINHYFLIPRILKIKGVIYYGFGVAATILIFYPILGLLLSWMPIAQLSEAYATLFDRINQIMNYGSIPFLVMFLSVPIILVNQWFQQNSEIAILEKEKSDTELNFLKQQINPHFFFNTLNNLYALSITKDPQTPEVIMKLSELMRYVIYKGKEDSVALKEEIQYIEDYIQLQQIRLHKKLDFRFEKNISNPNLKIPPLLFIVLVENAFKHGIENAEEDCFLHMYIKSGDDHLSFICKNSFEEKIEGGNGIGLDNLKRRLELRFPNQYQFKIKESKSIFEVELKIFDITL